MACEAGVVDVPSPQMMPDAIGLCGLDLTDQEGLTPMEKEEICAYKEVFFTGRRGIKKTKAEAEQHFNHGYDNEEGRYRFVKGDHLAYRFECVCTLGKGAFSNVFRVWDHKHNKSRAVKIVRSERRFHEQVKNEIRILKAMRSTPHSIHMVEHFKFRNHVCILFELEKNDLYSEMKNRGFKPYAFDIGTISLYGSQLVHVLSELKRQKIVHGDIKPENILVTDNGILVTDYGSACFEHGVVHTYVQSRYYRSPEITLGLGYGCSIDMWSLGCVLYELAVGTPIFQAKNEFDLIRMHAQWLGMPPNDVLERASRTKEFFVKEEKNGRWKFISEYDRKGHLLTPGSKSLSTSVVSQYSDLEDFISQCLVWDPAHRLIPSDALEHPLIHRRVRPRSL